MEQGGGDAEDTPIQERSGDSEGVKQADNPSIQAQNQGHQDQEQVLKDLHTILLETQVVEGLLVCGNCGHEYPIKESVANFLLPSHLGTLSFSSVFLSATSLVVWLYMVHGGKCNGTAMYPWEASKEYAQQSLRYYRLPFPINHVSILTVSRNHRFGENKPCEKLTRQCGIIV